MKSTITTEVYIAKHSEWKDILEKLRSILTSTELDESIKWGAPIYSFKGKNVIGMAAFKHHVSLWFHHGVFLKDTESKLISADKEKTRGLRQWRFSSMEEIDEKLIKKYTLESIENEKAGKRIKPQIQKVKIPEELSNAMKFDKNLKSAYEKLTPGKQREYCSHIIEAKQEATRLRRLEKCIPLILAGKGLHDKYK